MRSWRAREIYRRFLVNKHGDLYFFIFLVKIVLFELGNLKKNSSGKIIK